MKLNRKKLLAGAQALMVSQPRPQSEPGVRMPPGSGQFHIMAKTAKDLETILESIREYRDKTDGVPIGIRAPQIVGKGVHDHFLKRFEELCVSFFRGVSGAIVVLHSSLSSFVVSTRLIRSGAGAIDSPDQSRQTFDQYDTSGVPEKIFGRLFDGLS